MFCLDSTASARAYNSLAKALLVVCSIWFAGANAAGSLPSETEEQESLSAASTETASAAKAVDVENLGVIASEAYFRLMPPGRSVSSAYMLLNNISEHDSVLLSMQSDQAERVELHEHSHSDGMMRMRKLDKLTIAAGESVRLAPGGYHLMLFGLQAGLTQDDIVTVELSFDSGKSVIVNAKARSLK